MKGKRCPVHPHPHRHNHPHLGSESFLAQTRASSWVGMASWRMVPTRRRCRYIAETCEFPSVSLTPLLSLPKMYCNHFIIEVLNDLPSKTSILAKPPPWLTSLIGPT